MNRDVIDEDRHQGASPTPAAGATHAASPGFFESLDRVNRAMHGTSDLEQVMRDVLDVALSIFGCDRAFLLYAVDPDAPFWEIPMERVVPAYPGAFARGRPMPTLPGVRCLFESLLSTDGPVELLEGREIDPQTEPWRGFQIRSVLAIAMYPKIGKPWQFGLHQCSHPRRFTPEEKLLFQEISRRLADGLTSLLVYRDLRRSEQFLDSIIEHIPSIIFVKDAETLSFLRINRAAERFFGRSRGEVLGRHDHDLFPKASADFFVQKDREALATGKLVDIPEELAVRGDGARRIMHTRKLPITDELGSPRYLCGIADDITDRKSMEEHLQKAQKLESIGRLAGGIAHDFNNMLGVIMGNCDIALAGVDPHTPIHERLSAIRTAAERSSDLTRQLLAFARQQAVAPQVLDPTAAVGRMLEMLRILIGSTFAWSGRRPRTRGRSRSTPRSSTRCSPTCA